MKTYSLFSLAILLLAIESTSQQKNKLAVKITPLAPDMYVHTSYKLLGGHPFPSNGLVLNTQAGVVLIDTGWGEEPTAEILTWVKEHLKKPVIACIVTHAHDDRIGGIKVLQAQKIKVYSTRQTAALALKDGYPAPNQLLPDDTTLIFGQTSLRTYYPGPGHAPDNITVWFPAEKVLVGGCFVKSTEAKDLGNVADANLNEWPNSLRKVMMAFPEPAFVIPGHQSWQNVNSLQHTLQLLENHTKKSNQ